MDKIFQQTKTNAWRTFEFILLTVVLSVIALRATYAESPNTTSIVRGPVLGNAAFSLIITSVLVFCFAAWLLASLVKGKIRYRFNWIEAGTFLFIVAGIIAVFAASNKRFAITELVTIAAPMLAAVMLVQILDSDARIKLVLMTIIACGVVSTYKCSEDYFTYNQMLIDQYEENPAAQLRQLGIEEGTFQHFSYEHRLFSKDVRGFLTTGNSAASFSIMAIFASLAFFWKRIDKNLAGTVIAIILTAALCFTLFLTRSKGGFAAFAIALLMISAYLLFGRFLKRFKLPILILVILTAVLFTTAAVWYGMEHNRLPGGNSMLVRWQYWVGAVKTYTLKPLTGVGGGNFGSYYMHFKNPQALESVKDPHNFLLSLLSQYGPFALIGFCGAFLLPMIRLIFSGQNGSAQTKSACSKKKHIAVAGTIVALLLIFRPVLLETDFGDDPAVAAFAAFYIYVIPALIFLLAYSLMAYTERKIKQAPLTDKTAVILFCALAAVVLHNLIDFAIFEPAVATIFWTLTAAMIAGHLNNKKITAETGNTYKHLRLTGIFITLLFTWAFVNFALIPPVYASYLQEKALNDSYSPHKQLNAAIQTDPLSDEAPDLQGKLLIRQFQTGKPEKPEILHKAADRFITAKERDPANFKYYEKLSNIYDLLASETKGPARKENLEKAAYWMDKAIDRYPNSARLHIDSARLAETTGNSEKALKHYKKAIGIEDAYRQIFKVMYPDTDVFSRLGEDKYRLAKKKVRQYSQ